MGPIKPPRHETFAQRVASGMSGTDAYLAAGYKPRDKKSARECASRLAIKVNVADRIAELRQSSANAVSAALNVDVDWIRRRYLDVVLADPNDLIRIEVGACRYCHGRDHQYHWRTEAEFELAYSAWANLPERRQAATPMPTDAGGYGYRAKLEPHPECPNCDGDGRPREIVRPSKGHPLYAGIKRRNDGSMEILMLDRMDALMQVGRTIGAFKDDKGSVTEAEELMLEIRRLLSHSASGPVLNYGALADAARDVTPTATQNKAG